MDIPVHSGLLISPFLVIRTINSLYFSTSGAVHTCTALLYYYVLHIGHSIYAAQSPIFNVYKRLILYLHRIQACVYKSALRLRPYFYRKSIVDGTGGLLAQKRVCTCKCVQKLTLKSSGVVVEWCGALKTPGESMERDREVWSVDGGGWQPQVGGDDPKKACVCMKIKNVDEILLKIGVAT